MRSRPTRRGAAAIEFALCLPIFIVIIAAIVDLTSFLALLQVTQRSARDGARIGSTVIEGESASGDEIEEAAEAQSRLMLEEAGVPCGSGCDVDADWVEIDEAMYVRVRITYPFDPIVGLADFLPEDAAAQFVMMTQQQ